MDKRSIVLLMFHVFLKKETWDFPDGPVVKNPPCNAEDAGSIPDQGTKIPRATGQLSPHTIMSLCAPSEEPSPATKTRCSQMNFFKKQRPEANIAKC